MTVVEPGTFTVRVDGDPVPWKRARKNGRRHFTDDAHRAQMNAWKMAWRIAYGHRQMRYGPVEVVGAVFLSRRPVSHFLADGSLSAAGRRSLWPDFDVDNALKLVLDALNKTAYHDDKQVRIVNNVAAVWLPTLDGTPSSYVVLRERPDLAVATAALADRVATEVGA